MMNIKSLTPKQRKTLEGLAKLGRPAKRLEIAQSCGIDGTQAAHALSRLEAYHALSRLEAYGFCENDDEYQWTITDAGKSILLSLEIEDREANNKDASNSDEEPAHSLEDEIKALRGKIRYAPDFSTSDAAFVCKALSEELADMPSIAMILAKMARYWDGLKS